MCHISVFVWVYTHIHACHALALTFICLCFVSRPPHQSALECQLLSIAGSPPSDAEWTAMLARITGGKGSSLLRIDFAEIPSRDKLCMWIQRDWFPRALVDADAATILTGARPVRAVVRPEGVVITWETLRSDLTAEKVGELLVRTADVYNDLTTLHCITLHYATSRCLTLRCATNFLTRLVSFSFSFLFFSFPTS
jgi:hypothetical protein